MQDLVIFNVERYGNRNGEAFVSSNQLFIIGNGFDRWHQLPTSYEDFYKQYRHYLDEIEHYFPYGLQEEELWSDFENTLGRFDESILIEENDFMDFSEDSFPTQQLYGLEDAVDEFSREIVEAITNRFNEWVQGINLTSSLPKVTFPETSQFISFNYTSTLQRVYKTSENKVYHIHGSIGQRSHLIFGHNAPVQQATADEDSYYTDAINSGRKVLVALQKPVNEIIKDKLTPWLESRRNISTISVIGHSLNNIDLPYFERILNEYPEAHWQCYSLNKREARAHKVILQKIGIPQNNILVGTYKDLVQHYPLQKATKKVKQY